MRDRAYLERLSGDLARWRARGWISAEAERLIRDDVEAERGAQAGVWLAVIGASFAVLALIALVADNWAGLARGAKVGLAAFGVVAAMGVAAWAVDRGRPLTANLAGLVASGLFAAGVAVIGQTANLSGDLAGAAFLAALGAGLVSFVTRTPAAAVLFFVFGAVWFAHHARFGDLSSENWSFADAIALLMAAAGVLLGKWTDSRTVRQFVWVSIAVLAVHLTAKLTQPFGDQQWTATFAFLTLAWTMAGWIGRNRMAANLSGGRTLYGHAAWFAVASLLLIGVDADGWGIVHRGLVLAACAALSSLAARDRHGWAAAAGILGMVAACALLLFDLGLPLLGAAGVFGVGAVLACFGAWIAFRKPPAPKPEAPA